MRKRCATDECYITLESGSALYRGPISEEMGEFWRCYTCHDGPVAAVLVPHPVQGLEITVTQGSG